MRLHHLSITAFGPFVDTVAVDFDDLASAGLFLLTGDTGSGKTSVLDAVCFALYGEVPGDRHTARHLRSDQADPQTEPLVVLTFSVGVRTFRFTRSPAWERPKRRGSGTTRVQAHAVAEELRSGDWVALTHRVDEAGQLVTGLLGMTCTQFTQVAMLPQGRFQAFLRATSTERHAVLQRLFRTRRYEEAERWLVERRVDLRRRCQTHHDVCAGVVNRLQEAAGVGVPEVWDLHALDAVAEDGSLERWSAARLAQASAELTQRRVGLAAATTRVAADQEALERARADAAALARGVAARRKLEQLDATAAEATVVADALDAHRRATTVLPQAARLASAEARHGEAEDRAASHVESVCEALGVEPDLVDIDSLTTARTRLAEQRAVAESWLPRERQVQDERSRVEMLEVELGRLTNLLRQREARATDLRAERTQRSTALLEVEALAERAPADRAALESAELGLEAAAESAELSTELTRARARSAEAAGHAQDLRQDYLDLREQRITGMAAELAGSLAAGCSCPVCGSVEHPSPATAATAVGRAEEEAARERYENADFESQNVRELVTTLATRLQAALVRSGGHTLPYWRRTAGAAAAAAVASTAAERDCVRLREELVTIEREAATLGTDLAASRVSLEERTRQAAEAEQRHEHLAVELEALLAGHPGVTSVNALLATLRRSVQTLDEARAAVEARERAAEELTRASAASEEAAAEAGFGSLAEALGSVIGTTEAEARSRRLDERRLARAAAEDALGEEAVRLALAGPAPDLVELAARLAEAGRLRDQAHAAHEQAIVRARRLESLGDDLARALAAWTPAREEHALTAGLAALVEGKSADNQWRMRLSAYVLSERLRQVVAAANDRLGTMTDRRFTLEQADERGAGEQRGGLSLRVRDEWSGKHRDPATLSGGETFIVSLALALGLADTVSQEAGGTQLDTLFIDEGFGALDAATLDGVMDTLDALRDGGRVVGVVSHVAELRNRIPARLEVRKARRGSTVRASLAEH